MKKWSVVFIIPLLFGVLNGCGGISQEVYKRDLQNVKMQVEKCEEKKARYVKQCEKTKKELNQQLADALQQKGALSKNLEQTLQKVRELQEIAQKRAQALNALKAKVQSLVDAGKLKIRTFRGMLVLEMGEKILFDVGKANLTPEGQAALAQLTPILASMDNRHFQVAGHTDNTGSPEFNWKLSLRRALNVVLYMISQGMPPDRISAAGYGQYAPIASNDTEEGRAANRRIDIILIPNIEELLQ